MTLFPKSTLMIALILICTEANAQQTITYTPYRPVDNYYNGGSTYQYYSPNSTIIIQDRVNQNPNYYNNQYYQPQRPYRPHRPPVRPPQHPKPKPNGGWDIIDGHIIYY